MKDKSVVKSVYLTNDQYELIQRYIDNVLWDDSFRPCTSFSVFVRFCIHYYLRHDSSIPDEELKVFFKSI